MNMHAACKQLKLISIALYSETFLKHLRFFLPEEKITVVLIACTLHACSLDRELQFVHKINGQTLIVLTVS